MNGLHLNCDRIDDAREDPGTCAAGRPVECTLAEGSAFSVQAAIGTIPVPAVGSIDIAIGGSDGIDTASCEIREVEPFNLPGVGFVCLAHAQGCPAGRVDCDGGSVGGVATSANRDIGTCESNLDCEVQCNQFCEATGSQALGSGFGCEGFCSGNSPENQPCTTDAECGETGNGACYGPDGVSDGNICECICTTDELGSVTKPGEISCQLGVALNIEAAAPCDGADTIIDFGSICTPITTGPATVTFNNFNNQGGDPLLTGGTGSGLSCFDYDADSTSGVKLEGGITFFGSTLGDLLVGTSLRCE